MVVARLFDAHPEQWGLRGDPYLWQELADGFKTTPLPATEHEFEALLADAFQRYTLDSLKSDQDSIYIERFARGGMSSGHVSLEFWRDQAIPLLMQRFRIELSGGKKESNDNA